jgi:AcrR family transcriptional regulator
MGRAIDLLMSRRPPPHRPGAEPGPTEGRSSRPLRADARRNRERVLQAASEAFAAHGPAVRLDEIAGRAGVGVGTVYRHFATKEVLLEAVVSGRLAQLTDEARALVDAADPAEAFFDFVVRMVGEAAAKRDLLEALAGSDAEAHIAGSSAAQELRAAFAELLQRAQRAQAVRTDVSSADVIAAVLGAASRATSDQTTATERSPTLVLDIVRDGLRPDRGDSEVAAA